MTKHFTKRTFPRVFPHAKKARMKPPAAGQNEDEVIMMQSYEGMDNDMGRYFRTLPKNIQEDILQSGVVFRTEADMRRCVNHLNSGMH